MAVNNLLFSILTEDIPFDEILRTRNVFRNTIEKLFSDNSIEKADLKFFATRNRSGFIAMDMGEEQPDYREEVWGPPKAICFDGDHEPTKALSGFCKKAGIDIAEAEFHDKGGKPYAFFNKSIKGERSVDILSRHLPELISRLPYKKKMNFDGKQNYIRPIRRVLYILGDQVIPLKIFDVCSSNTTLTDHFSREIKIDKAGDFIGQMEGNGVLVELQKREDLIRRQLSALSGNGMNIELEDDKLTYLAFLNENPRILAGSFPENFLDLPAEIIDQTLWKHQKCVALTKDNKVTNSYITVVEEGCDLGKVEANYSDVMLSRLYDARFFFNNDLKHKPDQMQKKLEHVVYFNDWGTIARASEYLVIIGEYLARKLDLDPKIIRDAAHYSKIDLVSEIISEKTYTDLQGIMAGYYLKEAGFAKGICAAVSQQYLPAGENSALPETIEGAILSLSNKILLMAVSHFLNLPVTGSKDIYGVRRAALGFYKVLSEFDIHIDVSALLNRIDFLNEMQKKQVYGFIVERIRAFESEVHGISREIIDAAAYSPEPDLLMLKKKIYSLEEFSKNPAFSDTKTTLKRVLNILEKGKTFEFQEDFLIEDAEKQLFDEFILFKEKVEGAGADFDRIWSAILDLKPEIDNFFDKVMVNVEDEKIKNNRKGLLALIGDMLLKIANFKIIS